MDALEDLSEEKFKITFLTDIAKNFLPDKAKFVVDAIEYRIKNVSLYVGSNQKLK